MGHFMQFILNASLKSVYPHMSFQACLRLITRPKNEQIQLKIQTNVKTLKKKHSATTELPNHHKKPRSTE